jgi:tetratricopeptide (TPR) repeat protein
LPDKPPVLAGILGALVLLLITALVLRRFRTQPWLIVGWLWFLGTLLPVIGILQVGRHAMADRYSYIPLIGVFLAAVWSVREWSITRPASQRSVALAAVGVLLLCLAIARPQLMHWQNDLTLFSRAASIVPENALVNGNLGVALANAGRSDEAILEYRRALRAMPNKLGLHYNIGIELANQGDWPRAITEFAREIELNPDDERPENNQGIGLAELGHPEQAIPHFERAMVIKPGYSKSYFNCAMAQETLGRYGAAWTNYSKTLELESGWEEALNRTALFLATCPDAQWRNPALAVKLATRANELTANDSVAFLDTLAVALVAAGDHTNAVATAERALTLAKERKLSELTVRVAQHLEAIRAGGAITNTAAARPFSHQSERRTD